MEKFRKDWILKNYTEETWNSMYAKAGKEPDSNVEEFNSIYNNPTHAENVSYNNMYSIVESGESITDATMAKEVENWNNGILNK